MKKHNCLDTSLSIQATTQHSQTTTIKSSERWTKVLEEKQESHSSSNDMHSNSKTKNKKKKKERINNCQTVSKSCFKRRNVNTISEEQLRSINHQRGQRLNFTDWQQKRLTCGKTVGVKLKGVHRWASCNNIVQLKIWVGLFCDACPWFHAVLGSMFCIKGFHEKPIWYSSMSSVFTLNGELFNCSLLLSWLHPESSSCYLLNKTTGNQYVISHFLMEFCTTQKTIQLFRTTLSTNKGGGDFPKAAN